MLLPHDDTICALATPPGTAGIGVIRLSGPQAFAVADAVTRRSGHQACSDWAGHTLHRADVVSTGGETIDDVLLAIFHAPRSYTGEDVVEISGHGGPVPLRRIMARLLEQGARLARPGEFTQRAFLNGKMDLAQAEAVGDIIAAQTEEAHRLARRQGEGRLSREVGQIRDTVLGVLARIEASIDFPEDVGELDTRACDAELGRADAQLQTLLGTADRGILYREGLKVVLAGRPNVGKSSLLNALLRAARAIVTPIPGTTRDVIEESLNLRGIPLRALDTAGLRETEDLVERLGVERTRESMDQADLILLVCDATVGETPEDAALRASLADRPHLIVWNKWDLVKEEEAPSPPSSGTPPPKTGEGPVTSAHGSRHRGLVKTAMTPEAWSLSRSDGGPSGAPVLGAPDEGGEGAVPVSAATGWNIEGLEDAIVEAVTGGAVAPSEADAAIVTHARHRHALQAARAALAEARATLEAGLPADFVSIDVRGILTALGEITGETATEDVIQEIFSRFCIGK